MNGVKSLSWIVVALGVIGMVMGAVFLGLGFARDSQIKAEMRAENVSLADLGVQGIDAANVIDSMSEAEAAANTVKEHRHNIAASYEELLEGGRFDPTNPQHLSYSQAINLENYLYLGVMALGVTSLTMASGAFMLASGIALVILGLVTRRVVTAS